MMLYVMDFRPAPSDGGVVVKFQRMRSPIVSNIRGDVMRVDPSAAGWSVTLSALVWLVWYRMGVTRGGHVDGVYVSCTPPPERPPSRGVDDDDVAPIYRLALP